MGARRSWAPEVAGSNPVAPTIFVALERDKLSAAVAQLVEYWPSKPRVAGSIPSAAPAPVAQRIEHWISNPRAVGSSPARRTNLCFFMYMFFNNGGCSSVAERLTVTQDVVGSNPTSTPILKPHEIVS